MSFWNKLFGSSTKSRGPIATAPAWSNKEFVPIEQQRALCDCCNQPASFTTGTYYTASEFLTLLRKGLELHSQVFVIAEVRGIPREAFMAVLPGEIILTYTTGWLLCPSCASQANGILPKRAGNLPGGEPDAKGRERNFLDAGTGKMFFVAWAPGRKALTRGAVSTKQADYYIISILPPAPDPASREALTACLLASDGYSKGKAQVQWGVSDSGAAALETYTRGLIMNYERTAKAEGKEVDYRRSKSYDFGRNGGPQGQLVAIFHTRTP